MKRLLTVTALAFTCTITSAQTTIFSESFGTTTVTTDLSDYLGFDNASLTFSGSGDVRVTGPSSGYFGASGNSNVFLTGNNAASLVVSGINTSGFLPGSLSLSFGASKSTTTSTMSELLVSYSTNDVDFFDLSFAPQPSGAGTTMWRSLTILNSTIIPTSPNLTLRWLNTSVESSPQFRLDDISLTGSAIPEPSTYALIFGIGALGLAGYRRLRTRQQIV